MNNLLITEDAIEVPLASQGKTIRIDMVAITKAEARMQDIQCVTPEKAPELLGAFTEAWSSLNKIVGALSYQEAIAKDNVKKERNRVLLDDVARVLEEKGLKDSRDLRDAIIDGDPKVQEAEGVLRQLECLCELMRGKRSSMMMAFTAVRKCLTDKAFNMKIPHNHGPGDEFDGGGYFGKANR